MSRPIEIKGDVSGISIRVARASWGTRHYVRVNGVQVNSFLNAGAANRYIKEISV